MERARIVLENARQGYERITDGKGIPVRVQIVRLKPGQYLGKIYPQGARDRSGSPITQLVEPFNLLGLIAMHRAENVPVVDGVINVINMAIQASH